jgi:hypothetical protein
MSSEKKYKVHLSVECIGVAEIDAKSEEEALMKMKKLVQDREINIMALHPLYFRGAIENDVMDYVDLSL